MKKWIYLILVTVILLVIEYFYASQLKLHASFRLMVLFFAIQTFILLRLDHLVPDEWTIQTSLVKIVLRMLLSLIFIGVLLYTQGDRFPLVVQFISLYLLYMIFEIISALTNLRRN